MKLPNFESSESMRKYISFRIRDELTFRGAIFVCKALAGTKQQLQDRTITCNKDIAGIQDEIWHQFGIQIYIGAVLSVCSVLPLVRIKIHQIQGVFFLTFRSPFISQSRREDITIIILDTKLVPDFVLYACYFFIAGIRPVLTLPQRTNKSLTYENRDPKS